jgi:transcriptional regulator with XRE-family HTH domain
VEKFAERLKNLRIEKNLTQKDLAHILGFKSRSTISNYENNIREPEYEIIFKISEYFEVDLNFLLGKTDKK